MEMWVDGTKVSSNVLGKDHTFSTLDIDGRVYLKQGLYCSDKIPDTQSLYHDGMKIAVCPSDHNGYFDAILEKCYSEQPGPVIHIPKDPRGVISNWGVNHLNVFVLGSDGAIWNNPIFNDMWHAWTHTGNPGDLGHPSGITITSAPAAVSTNNLTIDVFAKGSDNSIWYISGDRYHPDGPIHWSGWK